MPEKGIVPSHGSVTVKVAVALPRRSGGRATTDVTVRTSDSSRPIARVEILANSPRIFSVSRDDAAFGRTGADPAEPDAQQIVVRCEQDEWTFDGVRHAVSVDDGPIKLRVTARTPRQISFRLDAEDAPRHRTRAARLRFVAKNRRSRETYRESAIIRDSTEPPLIVAPPRLRFAAVGAEEGGSRKRVPKTVVIRLRDGGPILLEPVITPGWNVVPSQSNPSTILVSITPEDASTISESTLNLNVLLAGELIVPVSIELQTTEHGHTQ